MFNCFVYFRGWIWGKKQSILERCDIKKGLTRSVIKLTIYVKAKNAHLYANTII